ncbi:hypothetical protein [Caloramator fervidus]|nr:hypothetical protein [Caloramator fervidus]
MMILYLILLISFVLLFIYNKNLTIKIFVISLLILMLIFPQNSIQAAKKGINLWLYIVAPSLFPFFVLNDIIISLGIPENISNLFSKTFKKIFNTSGYGAYVFIMSIFTGYPTGAKIVSQLIEEKKITSYEGQKILNFASTSGPLFIIGAVGIGMFKNKTIGYIILFSHIIGSIINGIIINKLCYPSNLYNNNINLNIKKRGKNLTNTITNSLYTIGIIGGYIIFFSVVIELIKITNIFNVIETCLSFFVPINLAQSISLLLQGVIEITNGCNLIALSKIPLQLKIIITTFLISFSGFSIIMQVYSITSSSNINIKTYIFSKTLHAIISSTICIIVLKYIPLTNIVVNLFNKSFNTINTFIFAEILLFILLFLNLLSYKLKK